MAQKPPELKVVYTYPARTELRSIREYNAQDRGARHALKYEDFLLAGIDRLAKEYGKRKPIRGLPNLKYITLKWRSKGHGHVVVYEIDELGGTVNILHLYHSRMDIQGRLQREFGQP